MGSYNGKAILIVGLCLMVWRASVRGRESGLYLDFMESVPVIALAALLIALDFALWQFSEDDYKHRRK